MKIEDMLAKSAAAREGIAILSTHILGFPQGHARNAVIAQAVKDLQGLASKDTVEVALRMAMRNDLWTDRNVSPSGKVYPPSVWDKSQIFKWATPAPLLDGSYPEPWRVSDVHVTPQWLQNQMRGPATLYNDLYAVTHKKVMGNKRMSLMIGLRDNRDNAAHYARIGTIALRLKELRLPHKLGRDNDYIILIDDLDENVLR